ncbi:MAG: acyl-ACP--UDP-N-acetylglucosamine O-acyltransferase [Methylococcales symbiont of Iophon sp. n. MRB-2018]|nr:MAG: acyl-ACP--UDP-N-acetylglucosamine O-acyltransferase [Methylococcales symbiont of Iophon sp. n. MRB-2018]KAF3978823.1 MAG: acyl-ACP--UDP-N-acetylglucosamine O-acyltransferase [Methylococcales symbiont of Iophon sp. n. MRB-2018]
MAQNIHPTAYIAPNVSLAENVNIGPFAVIEEHVTLADNCQLGAHSVIQSYVKMGVGNVLHPHAVLGGLPQDTSFKSETVSWLEIGKNNVFREGFTAHRSSIEGGVTSIGSDCFFMNNTHVAHDCVVGNNTIFATYAAIGGHVEVGENVFMGGGAVVHQFCRVGSYAIVQGATALSKDVIPFMLIAGRPPKHYRLNSVGLRRAGIKGDQYKVLSAAFRLLKRKGDLSELEQTEEIKYLNQWLAVKSVRGSHGFIEVTPA